MASLSRAQTFAAATLLSYAFQVLLLCFYLASILKSYALTLLFPTHSFYCLLTSMSVNKFCEGAENIEIFYAVVDVLSARAH